MKEPTNVHAEFLIACPFCGQKLYQAFTNEKSPVTGVIHQQPTCERFDTLNVEEFIAACQLEFAQRRN